MPDIPGWNIAKYPLMTPDTPSGDFICRLIRVPRNSSWSALVNGVLSLLLCPEHFVEEGTATRGETVQVYSEMFQEYVPLLNDLIGTVVASTVATIPDTQLLCDGSQYLRVDYPELYDLLDAAFIVDADNFVVPDLRNRFIQGVETYIMNENGGAAERTIEEQHLPAHDHTYNQFTSGVVPVEPGPPVPVAVPPQLPTQTTPTGGGVPLPTLPPFLALNWVIIAKC